ncbi:MAG: hypothetical protein AAF539_13155 [Planctomycetota bacterium]
MPIKRTQTGKESTDGQPGKLTTDSIADVAAAIARVSGMGLVPATAKAEKFNDDEKRRLLDAVETKNQPRETLQQILSRIANDSLKAAAENSQTEPVAAE